MAPNAQIATFDDIVENTFRGDTGRTSPVKGASDLSVKKSRSAASVNTVPTRSLPPLGQSESFRRQGFFSVVRLMSASSPGPECARAEIQAAPARGCCTLAGSQASAEE